MIVGHFRCQPGHMPGFLQRVKQPSCGRNPHGASVAEAAVRFRFPGMQPPIKQAAVAGIRINPAPLFHGLHQRGFDLLIRSAQGIHQRFRNGNGHHGIIRKFGIPAEQRKLLRFRAPVKLIGGADHIAHHRSDHFLRPPSYWMIPV